ncbi:hypothetical protein BKA70DRAFT_1521574 [Coprinopsis sp. MPI-PUGE-AT-0042]|nr:hypothetical protein BKA70DRAFT_1521574 [Coprinopsis sp. MPI-PUGE-AT-0042]
MRRFDLYRRRIRRLELWPGPSSQAIICKKQLDAILGMCQLLNVETLFPNLMYLSIHMGQGDDRDALIPLLLTPSLRDVHFFGVIPPPNWLFPLVSRLAPAVEALELSIDSESSHLDVTQLVEAIPLEHLLGLKRLRYLDIAVEYNREGHWILKMSSIPHLLRHLPCLTHLYLTVKEIRHDYYPSFDMASPVAPLEFFKLCYHPTSQDALQPIRYLPFVTHLEVFMDSLTTTPQDVYPFMSAVASYLTLSEFTLLGTVENDLTVTVEDILPLFSSRNLKSLVIHENVTLTHRAGASQLGSHQPGSTHPVIDVVLNTLKHSPGSLKELSLPMNISPMPTFDCLMKFAKHAPWLTHLTMPVGVCHTPDSASWSAQLGAWSAIRFEDCQTRSMFIVNDGEYFDLDDHPLMAKCLDAWFPNLEDLDFYEDCDSPPIKHFWSKFQKERRLEGEPNGRNAPYASARQQVLDGLVGADILPLVFEYLFKSTLFNAAVTCKAFSIPALDILWRRMYSFDPLLPLFVPPKNEVLDGDSLAKRSRFDLYRKRIRILHLGRAPNLHHSDDFARYENGIKAGLHMCHLMLGEKLLPNLTELVVVASSHSEADALIPLLLTRSLRLISVRRKTPPPEQFFSLVATQSPTVVDLALGFGREALAASVTKTYPLELLSNLEHLLSSVQHLLLHLPHLSHISITVNHIEHDWLSPVDEGPIVASLESFELMYYPNRVNGLQPFHSFPFITELDLVVDPLLFTSREVALFIRAVGLHPRLVRFWMSGSEDNHLTLDVGDVLPLFSSQTLHVIALGYSLKITHHAADGQACPESSVPQTNIVDLIVGAMKQHRGPLERLFLNNSIHPMPKFDALMQFAAHVPWLCELSIGACAPHGWVSAQLGTFSEARFENSLRKLSICNVSEKFSNDDTSLLAECIDAWFPNLDQVGCWGEFGSSSTIDKLRAEWKDKRPSSATQACTTCDTGEL